MLKFLLIIASFCLVVTSARAQDDSPSGHCVSLAARGDVAELKEVYDSLQTGLAPHEELYCQFAFARARGDNQQIVDIADTLTNRYAQYFEDYGLLSIIEQKCEALRQMGDYPSLFSYSTDCTDMLIERGVTTEFLAPLKTYRKMASLFANRQPITTQWEATSFAVPISRDWPLLIPAHVGTNADFPFFLDTSSRYSFISRADAHEWGVTVLGERVTLDTPIGSISAHPVILDAFTIGQLTLRHVMFFVVGDDVDAPYNRCLGNDILRHLQRFEINDQQLVVVRSSHSTPTTNATSHPLCFNPLGGLDLQLRQTDCYRRFSLDTSVLSDADEGDYRIKGVEYLKSSTSVVIDFPAMTLTPIGPRDYSPRAVEDYIQNEDYFELLRNEASLYFTASEEELQAVDDALTRALTPPDVHSLTPTVRSAIVTPERAAAFERPPHQLLVTSHGLIYERVEGKRLKTMPVTDKMAASHKIDIQNLKIY